MRLKLIVAVVAVFAILGATWAIGLRAQGVASSWTRLHVLRLPAPPTGLYPHLARPQDLFPVGIDSAGNIVLEHAGKFLVRYNPTAHRWITGELAGSFNAILMSSRGRMWLFDPHGSVPLAWAGFGTGVHRIRIGGRAYYWQSINDGAVDRHSDAWMIGSLRTCPRPQESLYSCGATVRAVLGHVTIGKSRPTIIPVPTTEDLVSVAVGPNGDVWMVAADLASMRSGARVIRYDPATGRFRTYIPPGQAGKAGKPPATAKIWEGSSLQVAPDGTVLMQPYNPDVFARHILVVLKNGSFTASRATRVGSGSSMIDAHGDLWYQNGSLTSALVIDAKTGASAVLSEPPGTLLQDTHGGMWWVEGP